MSKKFAVVDGANIAYAERSEKGEPKVSNILAVRAALQKMGYEPLIEDQVIRQVPVMIIKGSAGLYEPRLEQNYEQA